MSHDTNIAEVLVTGDDLLMARFPGTEVSMKQVQALAAALRKSGHWLEVVPGYQTISVQFDPLAEDLEAARKNLLKRLVLSEEEETTSEVMLELPVCYGGAYGPDLDMLARKLGLSEAEIIELHISASYHVDMIGFTPGFAYCAGLPAELETGRLEKPRQSVPAGSVGVAGLQTGLYGLSGPGGWPLIGRTPLKLFTPEKEQPFLVSAGAEITFKPVSEETFKALEGETVS